ncbi:carbohydrate ABC transporter permease [Ruania albidiflava]|uniref:carbohydrate ABC transporter permease n=1 Tax=Ruania albidiflava TaxID=366586 RepID=UPI0003B4B24A|nr:sugar ABC transporter permease [Ruania albidiflava]
MSTVDLSSPPKVRRSGQWREPLLFVLLVLPNVAVIVIFAYYPAIYNFILSFSNWDFLTPRPEWVGLRNYINVFNSQQFYGVLWNTIIFVGVALVATLVGGLAIGTLLSQRLRFSGFTRTMAFAPHMLPGAAVGILWLFMFDPRYGLSRWLFSLVGLDSPQWTTTSDWSIWAITIAYAWQRLGFVAIIYYSAIQELPTEVLEAAKMDGATGLRLARSVALPLLSPVTFFLIITGIVSSAQAFDIIATLTNGGPGTSSSTLTWMVYREAFIDFDVGRSATTATVLFLLLAGVTLIQARTTGKKVHYS